MNLISSAGIPAWRLNVIDASGESMAYLWRHPSSNTRYFQNWVKEWRSVHESPITGANLLYVYIALGVNEGLRSRITSGHCHYAADVLKCIVIVYPDLERQEKQTPRPVSTINVCCDQLIHSSNQWHAPGRNQCFRYCPSTSSTDICNGPCTHCLIDGRIAA